MNGGRYIKQAIIAALVEHPEQEKYKARAFSGENLDKVMDAISEQGNKLTKADFFTVDDEGRYLIDTAGFWKNFDKIREIIERAGEKFGIDDFTRALNRDETRTLVDSAAQYNGLPKLFCQETWAGRFDEMERLWYRVPMPSRKLVFKTDGQMDIGLKRGLLAAEGREAPEDMLQKAGLSPFDVKNAFMERGNYEELKRKLHQSGDYLRKDYLMLLDSAGDTAFYYQNTWDHYGDIVKNLNAHGQSMEVADFIRQIGTRPNILMRAAERNALNKVFTPEHWTNRLPEMMELWSCVLGGWKTASLTAKDFDNAYATAESLTYAVKVDFQKFDGKQALLQPLNSEGVEKGESPVLPLGLKAFWENLSSARACLAESGQKIVLDDLRKTSGYMGDSCLMSAVKFGHFSSVTEIVKGAGETLAVGDFLAKDRHGNTLLNILAERNELAQAFSPDMWVGRAQDMKTLWAHVRVNDRNQLDIQQAIIAVEQATLRQKAKNRFKLPGGPK